MTVPEYVALCFKKETTPSSKPLFLHIFYFLLIHAMHVQNSTEVHKVSEDIHDVTGKADLQWCNYGQ